MTHGKPDENMECLATMEDIDQDNYCEYQTFPSMKWYPSLYCAQVVQQLIETQFQTYINSVQKSDCQAELRRQLEKGPPLWLEDKHALPLQPGETHICQVWYSKENTEYSAKLYGAVEGEEREQLWQQLSLLLLEKNHPNEDEK